MKHFKYRYLSPFTLLLLFIMSSLVLMNAIVAKAEQPKKTRILFTHPMENGLPFWDSQVAFAQSVAAALNFDLEVLYFPKDQRNRFTAANYLKQVIESKKLAPDLVVTFFWLGSEESVLTMLKEKNIDIISINSDITPEQFERLGRPRERFPNWLLHLSPDDILAGNQLAAGILAQSRALRCPDKNCYVELFAITGAIGSAVSAQRVEGLKQVFENDENSKIINIVHGNWEREFVEELTKKIFLRHAHIDAFWVASDVMTYGLFDGLAQIKQKLSKKTVIGSIDWSPETIEKIKNGEMNISLGGHFMEGGWALILYFDYLQNIDFAAETTTIIKTEMSILDKYNIDQLGPFLSSPAWSATFLQSHSKFLNPARKSYNLNPQNFIMQQLVQKGMAQN